MAGFAQARSSERLADTGTRQLTLRGVGRKQLTVEIRRSVVKSERAHELGCKTLVLEDLLVELDVACAGSAVDLEDGGDAAADGESLRKIDVLLEKVGEVVAAQRGVR